MASVPPRPGTPTTLPQPAPAGEAVPPSQPPSGHGAGPPAEGTVYVASDVHLGAVPRERERSFVAWLEHAAARASLLVLNGDLFDFWFEYRTVVPRGHTRVLGTLARIVDAGVPVILMGGNHDWWAGSYLQHEVGLTVHREAVVLSLAGRRTLLAHGDGLGAGDLGYRLLRLVLRGRLTLWAFRWLHPDVGARIATRASRTEERETGWTERQEARARHVERWAVAQLEADPTLDLVLLGHTHQPAVREVEPGRFYVNGGDWVGHRSYVVLEKGRPPEVREWEG